MIPNCRVYIFFLTWFLKVVFFLFLGKMTTYLKPVLLGLDFFFFFLSPKVIYLFLDVGEDLTVVI